MSACRHAGLPAFLPARMLAGPFYPVRLVTICIKAVAAAALGRCGAAAVHLGPPNRSIAVLAST